MAAPCITAHAQLPPPCIVQELVLHNCANLIVGENGGTWVGMEGTINKAVVEKHLVVLPLSLTTEAKTETEFRNKT